MITPKEARERWVAALRSGKYQQTQSVLHRTQPSGDLPAGFCCLGVGCEVALEAGLDIVKGQTDQAETYNGKAMTMPFTVRDFFGLGRKEEDALIGLNDDEGRTFEQIADYIEENFNGD